MNVPFAVSICHDHGRSDAERGATLAMNRSVPDYLKTLIDGQVAAGGRVTTSAYNRVRHAARDVESIVAAELTAERTTRRIRIER